MTIEAVTPPAGDQGMLGAAPVTPPAAAPIVPAAEEYAAGDWRATLPAELKAEPMFKTIGDINTLAKSYVHAQKAVGADKIALPGKHATEEDWHRFRVKTGLPETPDLYEVAVPKEAKFVNPDLIKELKPIAHKAGIMPKQLEALVGWYEQNSSKEAQAALEQIKQQRGEQVASLKKEWGTAFDNNLGYANKVLKDHGHEELGKYLKETGLDNDPNLVKLLAKIGQSIYKEDQILGDRGVVAGANDPATAMKKANDILGNAEHPYYNASHPNHAAAVAEVNALFLQANPQT